MEPGAAPDFGILRHLPFKTTDTPPSDRSTVWRLSRQRYYGVPVVFETDEFSQIIAEYLDARLQLNLFPSRGLTI